MVAEDAFESSFVSGVIEDLKQLSCFLFKGVSIWSLPELCTHEGEGILDQVGLK